MVAIALIAGGATFAVRGYAAAADPQAPVLAYFAALTRDDAPAALALTAAPRPGDPADTDLLTSEVLAAQNSVGTVADLSVTGVRTAGDRGTVAVAYRVRADRVTDAVPVVRADGRWLLAAAAVPVSFVVPNAGHRFSLAGAAVPTTPVMVFPGADPVRPDTADLQVAANAREVRFAAPGPLTVTAELSAAGRRDITAAVTAALDGCLTSPQPSCPLPDDGPRVVPATLRGGRTGPLDVGLTLVPDPDGEVDVAANGTVNGHYRQLSFENQAADATGPVHLVFTAHCWADAPARIVWGSS